MQESRGDVYDVKTLFGGDIVCSLPTDFIDVSQIRQIPDNQECFIERDGYTSIIFDILDRIGPAGSGPKIDGPALTEHIQDIVGEDEGDKLKVWNTTETKFTRLHDKIPAYTLIATTPSGGGGGKRGSGGGGGGKEPASLVFTALILTLIRLEKTDTDVVVTINVPHIKGEYDEDEVDLELGNRGRLIGKAVDHASKIWESFAIKNLGLFGKQYEGRDYDKL